MRKQMIIVVAILTVTVFISTLCFAEEKPAEQKQFCEGVGPLYWLDKKKIDSRVGAFRPILKNGNAILVLADSKVEKIIGIMLRTTIIEKRKSRKQRSFSF